MQKLKKFSDYSGPTVPVEVGEVHISLVSVVIPTYSENRFTGWKSIENLNLEASVIDQYGDPLSIYEAISLKEAIKTGLCTELDAAPVSLFLDLIRANIKNKLIPPNLLYANSIQIIPIIEYPTIAQD
jgi:hypothetical protein